MNIIRGDFYKDYLRWKSLKNVAFLNYYYIVQNSEY